MTEQNKSDEKSDDQKTVIARINKLTLQHGFSKVALERALNLSFGTLDHMVSMKRPPRAFMALTKILVEFPWIVHVAENHYEKLEAFRYMAKAAIDVLVEKADR